MSARRCLSCQYWFEPLRADARCCSAKCRVALNRAGGAKRIHDTLRRPAAWWDDVRTYQARLAGLYEVVLRPSLLIEVPPATVKQLEPVDDRGNLGVAIIIVQPAPGSISGGVTDRVALKGGRP